MASRRAATAPRRITAAAPTPEPAALRPTGWKSRYALFLLMLVAIFNSADRQILAVLLEPIRQEFGASDTAMGVLNGLVFSLFYAVALLPIARMADLRTRRTIISAGLLFWSAMTSASGLARSFGQLALARVGVGVGEASYLPAAMSTTSDLFPARRRTLAFSVLTLGLPVGAMLSLVVGGRLEEAIGWRMTMAWIGAAGMLLAVLVRLTLPEPERGGAEVGTADVSAYPTRATMRYLWGLASYRHVAAAATLGMLASGGVRTWAQAFLQRAHGLTVAEAAGALGPALGLGGVLGLLLGGGFTQLMGRRDVRWLLWMPALLVIGSLPFLGAFLTLPSAGAAAPMYVGVAFCNAGWMGAVMATVQGLAKVRMRALAGGMVSLCINLIGGSLGPVFVGALSDALQPAFGDLSLRYSIAAVGAMGLWAALHFVLATRTLRAELARAGAGPRQPLSLVPQGP